MGKYRFPILEYARFETIKAGLVKSNVTSETRIVVGSRIDPRSGNDRIDAIRASIDRSIHRSQHRHAFVFLPWAKEHACTLLAAKSRIKNLSCDIRSERKSYQRGRGIGAVARSWKRFVRKRFDAKRQSKHTVLGVVSRFAFLLRTATCGGCYREYISVARKEEINSQQAVKKSVPKACAPSPW